MVIVPERAIENLIAVKIWFNSQISCVENSCARTDAVFTPYPGFKSHVKGKEKNVILQIPYISEELR